MLAINTVPNQRVVTVHKAPADKSHLYTTINLQALGAACNTLQSKAGIKLFLYLAKNQDKYTFALSRADFMEWAGVKDTAYKTAVDELIEKGYLVSKGGNQYTFYEAGKVNIFSDNHKTEKIIKKKDGFDF